MKALLETVLLCSLYACAANAKGLWSSQPAAFQNVIKTAYPVGNGQLGALPFGHPGSEKLSLNRDSLWSGGPFENSSYNGGNPLSSTAAALPGIREWIFKNGTGNVTALMGADSNYGSYAVLGNLSVSLQGISNYTAYNRSLDLETAMYRTKFEVGNSVFTTVCVYEVSSTSSLPTIQVLFENVMSTASLVKSSCSNSSQSALFTGITQADIGMVYKAEARVVGSVPGVSCSADTGILTIIPESSQRSLALVIAAGTDYDEAKGTAAANFSFKGVDPGEYVASTAAKAAVKSVAALQQSHIADYSALAGQFSLDLPDTLGSAGTETAALIAAYNDTDNTHMDPYLESLQFDYGRYLFISSSREHSLPPNLQGRWAYGLENAWGADYHANINLQMNHWGVDQTGLGSLQSALWTYMSDTWAPRGSETAKLLYNAPEGSWVTHDEMNVFGHTGMKTGEEEWADYPASAAWMMLHVADHFDYSQDVVWLRSTGYPLLKAISTFWLSQVQQDEYFKDGTLVVNPCSSPEHGPTTFGCTHYQQLLHSLFVNTLQASSILSDPDTAFTHSLATTLASLDKGLHIGSWGQMQEWKLDLDVRNDTHRHLSNLVGWYPGSSVSGHLGGRSNATIQAAVATTLRSRGAGVADANAGWEKVWRGACWARLNDTARAYAELRLALQQNMAANLLSMYSGKNEPFQIDANFGFGGNVLSMLVVDLPVAVDADVGAARTVVLGPAIPSAWGGGGVKGLRVRGGGVLDFGWDADGLVDRASWAVEGKTAVRVVNKDGAALC
ncbi:hypothetical protein MBLNU459_g7152t1 [Dothideomycetes sp. NU459]